MPRRKGSLGQKTLAIKTMVINALEKSGGVDYLVSQAKDNPTAFLSLVGKTLPLDVHHAGQDGEEIIVRVNIAAPLPNGS